MCRQRGGMRGVMTKRKYKSIPLHFLLPAAALVPVFLGVLWERIPGVVMRPGLFLSGGILFGLSLWGGRQQERRERDFANEICETVDALMDGREPENFRPCEDSQGSRVQGKLLQYYDWMQERQRRSREDEQTLQELVSDIAHQVRTPVANIRMFVSILRRHHLSEEKRGEFLDTLTAQAGKLDFLMQSLVKMSRLETGIFVLHMENNRLYDTIAQAMGGIQARAQQKGIQTDVSCESHIMVRHDAKWTAEAIGNILDNAVKYTPEGGRISVSVRPWQFYTRVDIADTGMGIDAAHYNDVFQRFYRAQEAAALPGVGLGLYLSRGIITRQKGYITVKSEIGKGTVFSVFLLN